MRLVTQSQSSYSAKPPFLPKSPSLLFHCHGGGFVAQSSQSHEVSNQNNPSHHSLPSPLSCQSLQDFCSTVMVEDLLLSHHSLMRLVVPSLLACQSLPSLLCHCHDGGFVAQSSHSHEVSSYNYPSHHSQPSPLSCQSLQVFCYTVMVEGWLPSHHSLMRLVIITIPNITVFQAPYPAKVFQSFVQLSWWRVCCPVITVS